MRFSEALRMADYYDVTDLRGKFVEEDKSKWGENGPPCCAIAAANYISGNFQPSYDDNNPGMLSTASVEAAQNADYLAIKSPFACPICQAPTILIYSLVVHLYDSHEWSRTQIADWLEEHNLWIEMGGPVR